MSFGRLRRRIVLKFVQHVQHDYFYSFNQSDHCYLVSSLPLQSSLLKLQPPTSTTNLACGLKFSPSDLDFRSPPLSKPTHSSTCRTPVITVLCTEGLSWINKYSMFQDLERKFRPASLQNLIVKFSFVPEGDIKGNNGRQKTGVIH